MAKLRHFRLEQRVITRIVHQADVVLKFRVEAYNKQGLAERYGMSFDQNLFRCGITQASLGVAEHFEDSGEPFGPGQLGLFGQRGGLSFRHLQHCKIAARYLVNEEIAEMVQKIREQASQVFAVASEV